MKRGITFGWNVATSLRLVEIPTSRRLVATLLLPALLTLSAHAADSTQFRGPGGLGVSTAKNVPVSWDKDKNVRWKMPLPGRGLSSPVLAEGRLYVTACSGPEQKQLHVLCFDAATGKQLWERKFWATGTTLCHDKTNMAAPTPVTDGKHIFALFASHDLVGLDRDGNLLWFRSLPRDYPTIGNNVGMASSPVLWKDVLILDLENAGESYAIGVDKATGKNLWKIQRSRVINWVTPLLADIKGRTDLVLQSPGKLAGHNPATGEQRWSVEDRTFATISSPTFANGVLFAPGDKFYALRPGDDSTVEEVWQSRKLQTGYSSPLYYQGKVITVSSRGVVNCADAKTGAALWDMRLTGAFSASPLAADGKIYLINEEGTTSVLQVGDQPKVLNTNSLDDTILACPVAADGALYLRSDRWLYCLGQAGNK